MNRFSRILILMVSFVMPAMALAVTDNEMEQAKALATKYYLRYVNNGSDYLDKLNPTSVAELEKELKDKEKKNIAAFKKVSVPSDYKNWTRDQLAEFWAVTALNTAGLDAEGKKAQWKIRSAIKAMKVAEPTPAASQPVAPEIPQATGQSVAAPQKTVEPVSPETALADSVGAVQELEALQNLEAVEEPEQVKKEGSGTWVYILALAVLVAAVIGLVVFASNVMKRDGGHNRRVDRDDEEEDHLREALDEKNSEIEMLTRKLESANRQNTELKQKLEALTIEVSALRSRKHEEAQKQIVVPEAKQEAHERRDKEQATKQGLVAGQGGESVRSIYLGRANSKGLFVRADRRLNPGNSIFRLDTTDGVSGTFRVANSPDVWEVALRLPKEYLGFACIAPDIEDTSGMTRIINDTPGSAVFEGGVWRVTRKARIHYE